LRVFEKRTKEPQVGGGARLRLPRGGGGNCTGERWETLI